MIEVYTDLT